MKLLNKAIFISFVLLGMSRIFACPERNLTSDVDKTVRHIVQIEDHVMESSCHNHENQFRDFIVQKFDESKEQWIKSIECQSSPQNKNCIQERRSFDDLMTSLNHYRSISQQMYQSIARKWYESVNEGLRSSVANCYLDQSEDLPIFRFGTSVRILALQNGSDQSLCIGQSGMWQENLVQAEADARSNPESYGLTSQDISFLDEFQNSFAGYLLSDHAKGNPNLTEEELRASVLRDMADGVERIESYRNELAEIDNPSQMYKVYQFQSLYQDQFLPSLSTVDRETHAPRCQQASRFSCVRATTPSLRARMEDYSRCAAQALDFGLEVIPFYSIFDAYQELGRTRGSFLAGAITEEERRGQELSNNLGFIFGVPVVPASGAVASRVGGGLLARQAGRESIESTSTVATRAFAPTTIDDLPLSSMHERIQDRITTGFAQLRRENPTVITEGNGAIFFHGSSSRSLTAFGTYRRAGGLRPTGELRKHGIEPLSGELGEGAGEYGINQASLSVVDTTGFGTAVDYTRIARDSVRSEQAVTGVSQERIDDMVTRILRIHSIADTPENRREIISSYNLRAIEPLDLTRFSSSERGFINDEFPVLYGLRLEADMSERIVGGGAVQINSTIPSELAVRGGVSFDEIRSIFVPPERVDEVRAFLRQQGFGEDINVVAHDF